MDFPPSRKRETIRRKPYSLLLLLLLVVLSPLVYLSLGLSLLAFDPVYYQEMQVQVGWQATPQLQEMDRALASYFQGREELPTELLQRFQAKEQVHLADIAWLLGILRWVTIIATTVFAALVILLFRRDPSWARRAIPWVLAATLAFLAAGGLAFFLAFDTLFLQFHLLTFSNDTWMLGPDYLLFQLFPPDLFFRSILPFAVVVILLLFLSFLASRMVRPPTNAPTNQPLPPSPQPNHGSEPG
jgi:integral membrane protein (TIGR01906 family)